MKATLKEALPPLIPEYPVEVAGHHLTLRFDVNINKTKKGVKLQFVMKDVPQDPRQVQQMANEIGTELQQKFGDAGLQVIYDVENPYKNVVGFLLPLPSLADYLIKHVLKGEGDMLPAEPEGEDEEVEGGIPPSEQLPIKELPPKEEPLKEWMKKMAGLK